MLDARRTYPSDLSDAEWALLAPLLPQPAPSGRPRKWPDRLVADAMFYVLRSGCAWRMLPREFRPWPTVYARFGRWRVSGTPGDLGVSRGGCVGVAPTRAAPVSPGSASRGSAGPGELGAVEVRGAGAGHPRAGERRWAEHPDARPPRAAHARPDDPPVLRAAARRAEGL